jgi:hypothetical protein
MRHDLEAALPADLKGSADLVVEQERMGVEGNRRLPNFLLTSRNIRRARYVRLMAGPDIL